MSENVVINGTTYNGVDALVLVRADGTVVTFYPDAVRYNAQTLTEAQKEQARKNIGAQAALTEADKEAIVQQVISALGTPVFGTVDLNKIITLNVDHLSEGAYTCGYEDKDGKFVQIGNIVLEAPPAYTNLLKAAGYKENMRLSGTDGKTEKEATGFYLTGYIPVPLNGVVRLQGIDVAGSDYGGLVYIYDENKNFFAAPTGSGFNEPERNCEAVYETTSNGMCLRQFTAKSTIMKNVHVFAGGYIRFGAKAISDDAIITVNEEIV